MKLRLDRSVKRQGLVYISVGILSAAIDFVTFQLLYGVLDVGIAIANPLAIGVSTVFNFALNRSVTFQQADRMFRSVIRYGLLLLFNTIVSTVLIALLIQCGASATLAKLALQFCIALWNFFAYKAFVFR